RRIHASFRGREGADDPNQERTGDVDNERGEREGGGRRSEPGRNQVAEPEASDAAEGAADGDPEICDVHTFCAIQDGTRPSLTQELSALNIRRFSMRTANSIAGKTLWAHGGIGNRKVRRTIASRQRPQSRHGWNRRGRRCRRKNIV